MANLDQLDPADRPKFTNLVDMLKVPGQVDLHWLLMVLSTLTDGNHRYFAKNFVPPPKPRKSEREMTVSNQDDFFSDLPTVKQPSKGRNFFMPKPKSPRQTPKSQTTGTFDAAADASAFAEMLSSMPVVRPDPDGPNIIQNVDMDAGD